MIIGLFMMTATAFADVKEVHVSSLEELQKAIDSLAGTTVTFILDDGVVAEGETGIGFYQSGNYTLDLNGQTLENTDVSVSKSANVTITGNGTIRRTGKSDCAVINDGNLTIENGTFEGSDEAISNGGKCTINGGDYTGYTTIYNESGATLLINNGSFKSRYLSSSESDAVNEAQKTAHRCIEDKTYQAKASGTTIKGGTFDSGDSVAGVVKYGKVAIEGGTFKGKTAVCPNLVSEVAQLKITGGDFTGCDGFFAYEYDDVEYAFDKEDLSVSGAELTQAQKDSIDKALLWGEIRKEAIKNAMPAKATISKVTAVKKGFKVSIKKTKNAEKYEISYRLKNAKKWTTVTSSKTTVSVKKLKSKKQYQVRVRGVNYYVDDMDVEILKGPWSAVKTVKVK